MFVVTNTRGGVLYLLARHGWTTQRERALTFVSRGRANAARRKAFKSRLDHTDIEPFEAVDALPDCVAAALLTTQETLP